MDGEEVVVYLGLSGGGDVKDARLEVEMLSCDCVDEEAAFLRKTRAGGNWLTGGIVGSLVGVLMMVDGGQSILKP
jgi:hypothetical protein